MKVTKLICNNCKKEISKNNPKTIQIGEINKITVGDKYIPHVKEVDLCDTDCLIGFINSLESIVIGKLTRKQ
ncbi:MAG: hypothetical protein ACOC2E_00060 [Bacteroidota bacterium]